MNARQTISNYFSRPSLPLICISFALEIITLLIMSPVSPLVILDACNGDTSKAAIISGFSLGLGSLCGFFCSPVLGILSDRYGRKPFLFMNVISVGVNILGILTVYYTKSLWVTFVSHAIGGCMSSIWAMSFVYVADITTEQDRSKSFGVIGATAGIAAIVGPGIASAASIHSLTTPLFIALGLMVFNLFFTGYVLPESRSVEFQMRSEKLAFKHVNTYSSYKLLFSNPFMISFAIGFCLNQITQFGILGTTVLYVKEVFYWSAWQAGIMFCVFGLFLMIAQGFLVRPCLRYLGEKYTIQAGLMLTTIAVVLFGIVNGWATFAVIPFKALGSIATPLLGAYISKQFEKEVQGKVLGALGGLQTISGFFGPILFSSLYSYYTSDRASVFFPQIIFYVAGGCELLAFFAIGLALYKMKTVSLIDAGDLEVTMITEEDIGIMPPIDKKAMEEPTPAVPEA